MASCSSSGEPKSSVSRVWASVVMVRDEARIQLEAQPTPETFPAEPAVITVACELKRRQRRRGRCFKPEIDHRFIDHQRGTGASGNVGGYCLTGGDIHASPC